MGERLREVPELLAPRTDLLRHPLHGDRRALIHVDGRRVSMHGRLHLGTYPPLRGLQSMMEPSATVADPEEKVCPC